MTLPLGTISFSDMNVELGKSATAIISLNDADVRALAGVASGVIDFQDLQGKSSVYAYTITTNQVDLNLRTHALADGWDGTTALAVTLDTGIYISGSVAGNSTAALTIDGSFPAGVTFINNGIVAGRGGTGGTSGVVGQAGGLALAVSSAISIENNGTVAGGGGGGGAALTYGGSTGCEMGEQTCTYTRTGAGGGGGRSNISYTSAGGSRLGGDGDETAAGAAGSSTRSYSGYPCTTCTAAYTVHGGAGGDWGAAGTNGFHYAGGAAGGAVTGDSNITWDVTGTRLGTIT